MKENQSLPDKHVELNNMTAKALSFIYRSRNNSRDERDSFCYRSPVRNFT